MALRSAWSRVFCLDALLHLGILALDTRLNERRMSQDKNRRGTDEPEERADGRGEPEKGEADDEETCVEGLLSHDVISNLHWLGSCVDIRSEIEEVISILVQPLSTWGGSVGGIEGFWDLRWTYQIG